MHHSLTPVHHTIQTLVETLISYGVVCKTAADGELRLELYSLLECLQPAEDDLPARLRQVRFIPTRMEELGLYLVYVPLSDVLVHLLPVSTLPEAHAWHRWPAPAVLPSQADQPPLYAGQRMTMPLD